MKRLAIRLALAVVLCTSWVTPAGATWPPTGPSGSAAGAAKKSNQGGTYAHRLGWVLTVSLGAAVLLVTYKAVSQFHRFRVIPEKAPQPWDIEPPKLVKDDE